MPKKLYCGYSYSAWEAWEKSTYLKTETKQHMLVTQTVTQISKQTALVSSNPLLAAAKPQKYLSCKQTNTADMHIKPVFTGNMTWLEVTK